MIPHDNQLLLLGGHLLLPRLEMHLSLHELPLHVVVEKAVEGDAEDSSPHSVLIKPVTLEFRHFLNLTSLTVLLFFLVLYVIVEQVAVLILLIFSLLSPP